MSVSGNKSTFDSPIASDSSDVLARQLKNHDSRMAIREVVTEYVASSIFADRVKDILLEKLESTETYKKLDDKVQAQIDKTLSDRGLRNRNFYIPAIISSIGVIASIIAVVVAMTKK